MGRGRAREKVEKGLIGSVSEEKLRQVEVFIERKEKASSKTGVTQHSNTQHSSAITREPRYLARPRRPRHHISCSKLKGRGLAGKLKRREAVAMHSPFKTPSASPYHSSAVVRPPFPFPFLMLSFIISSLRFLRELVGFASPLLFFSF